MRPFHTIVLLSALTLAACSRDAAPEAHGNTSAHGVAIEVGRGTVNAPAYEPAVELATPREVDKGDGCRVEVTADGNGALLGNGSVALIEYTARVKDAETPFASTKGWYQPLAVTIGDRTPKSVVPGLVRGLEGLRVGTRARIEVPPALAYGAAGAPAVGVPADATLVFDVEIRGAR